MDGPNGRLIQTLLEARQHHCFPPDVRVGAPELIEKVLALLFPHFSERLDCSAVGVRSEVAVVEAILTRSLNTLAPRYPGLSADLPQHFMEQLPELYAWLRQGEPELVKQAKKVAHRRAEATV